MKHGLSRITKKPGIVKEANADRHHFFLFRPNCYFMHIEFLSSRFIFPKCNTPANMLSRGSALALQTRLPLLRYSLPQPQAQLKKPYILIKVLYDFSDAVRRIQRSRRLCVYLGNVHYGCTLLRWKTAFITLNRKKNELECTRTLRNETA